jgi:hypothetical protein
MRNPAEDLNGAYGLKPGFPKRAAPEVEFKNPGALKRRR